MLKIHDISDQGSDEYRAAVQLAKLIRNEYPDIDDKNDHICHIFPEVQCYGQSTQDIDLVLLYADYRNRNEIEMNMFDWKNYSSRHHKIGGRLLTDSSSEISKR